MYLYGTLDSNQSNLLSNLQIMFQIINNFLSSLAAADLRAYLPASSRETIDFDAMIDYRDSFGSPWAWFSTLATNDQEALLNAAIEFAEAKIAVS